MINEPQQYFLRDTGIFPNSILPVLHYEGLIKLPKIFQVSYVEKIFKRYGWTNNWRSGIFTFNHYHSTTHEVLGIVKGKTTILLGGDNGLQVHVAAGDVLVIPAGVAHKNLGKEDSIKCVGGYPDGRKYDMNYGHPEERPRVDHNIAALPIPENDPVFGNEGPLTSIWQKSQS